MPVPILPSLPASSSLRSLRPIHQSTGASSTRLPPISPMRLSSSRRRTPSEIGKSSSSLITSPDFLEPSPTSSFLPIGNLPRLTRLPSLSSMGLTTSSTRHASPSAGRFPPPSIYAPPVPELPPTPASSPASIYRTISLPPPSDFVPLSVPFAIHFHPPTPPGASVSLSSLPNEILDNILGILEPVTIQSLRSHPYLALSQVCHHLKSLVEARCKRVLSMSTHHRRAPQPPFLTVRSRTYRAVLLRWLHHRCRYCYQSSSRLATMDMTVRACGSCDLALRRMHESIDVMMAEETFGIPQDELTSVLPHGLRGDVRLSLVRAHAQHRFGVDPELLREARRRQIIARPAAVEGYIQRELREARAQEWWRAVREDWEGMFGGSPLVGKRPTEERLDAVERAFWKGWDEVEMERTRKRLRRENSAAMWLIKEMEETSETREEWYREVAENSPKVLLGRVSCDDEVRRLIQAWKARMEMNPSPRHHVNLDTEDGSSYRIELWA